MAANECLFGESAEDLLRHHRVGHVAELFHDFMRRSSIEDIVFDGDVLIVKLVQQAK